MWLVEFLYLLGMLRIKGPVVDAKTMKFHGIFEGKFLQRVEPAEF